MKTKNPNIRIEIWWFPAHTGVSEGNEIAGRVGVRQAAEEPETRGVERLGYGDQFGRGEECPSPGREPTPDGRPRRKKWEEAWTWSKEQSQGKEARDAESDAPEQYGGMRIEAGGRAVPPAQDGALPLRAIPEVDKGLGHGRVRVMSI